MRRLASVLVAVLAIAGAWATPTQADTVRAATAIVWAARKAPTARLKVAAVSAPSGHAAVPARPIPSDPATGRTLVPHALFQRPPPARSIG